MGEKSFAVMLDKSEWRRILNLLTEELDVWEPSSTEYRKLIFTIWKITDSTGIQKKIRPSEVEKP